MRMHIKIIFTALLASALLTGCNTAEETVDEPNRPAGKADCPNCDPSGSTAFVQAGLETRWYRPGDKWHVAFQFQNRNDVNKEDILLATQRDEWTKSGVFLFQYEALTASEDEFNNQIRDIISIGVRQVDPAEVNLDGAGYFESERLDTHTHRVSFRMNDLTDALDITEYSRRYPNGRTTLAPSNAALSLNSNIFPVNVPRLLVGGADVTAPELPQDLRIIADSMDAGWAERTYKKYDFRNGDVVYWAKGYLWPFFIENAQGRGLLIDGKAN